MREFTEQELVRREKAENIRSLGIDPFGIVSTELILQRILKKNIKMFHMMILKI